MRASCTASVLGVAFAVGCSGANPSSGQTAYMRIQGAQYIAGPIDTTTQSTALEAPQVSTLNNELLPGVTGKSISGTVGPGSTAVLLGLQGDTGHWVIPVQDLDQNTPGNYTFSCSASFSPNTPTADGGMLWLVARATDKNGTPGPANLTAMTMLSPHPDGALVISLDWDTEADLDLHVVLPTDGDAGINEIWSRKASGLRAAGTDDAAIAAGYLDADSNSQCAIDGRRAENAIFPDAAPGGHYIVRVDTFSLCGEVAARWRLQVFTNGSATPLVAYGQSTDTDTRFPHGQGAGVQALVFDYNP
jgi:hypothetical protein